ncbi:MAG: rRNA pseudouridine synthase [Candidatus Omnitrophica bacterium]|nr:rRNA pseudouridine synthase [Candidatus Omnitrophota bacterium]
MSERLGKVPLERALSKLGLASRTQTREWILAGRLSVNGRVIKDLMFPVTPETDQFVLDGKVLERGSWQTIMFYKPRSVVTTRSDEQGRKTIYDILPPEFHQLHSVGRLDMASTGLLLLTNDTRLSDYLTDPRNAIPRTYIVTVEGAFTNEEMAIALAGVEDEGEILKPSKMTISKASQKESHIVVELTEGKNRELRRLFNIFNHRVRKLKRIAFGPLTIGNLEPGKYRAVTKEELGWDGQRISTV